MAGDGIEHAYCGRSHAREALEKDGKQLPPPHGTCHTCQLPGCDRPVCFEHGRVHEFCSKRHASQAIACGLHPAPISDPRVGRQGVGAAANTKGASFANVCSFPECLKPRFFDMKSELQYDYCGRTHAHQAAEVS